MEAIRALESLGRSERSKSRSDAVAPLTGFIATAMEDDVVGEALIALGGIGQSPPVDVISPFLSHAKPKMVGYAIAALGKLRKPHAAAHLIDFLHHESASIRFEAAIALGRCGGTIAVDDLRSTLNDEDERVRLAAADALYCLGEEEGLPTLRAAGALLGMNWYFLGAFDGLDGDGINQAYPPESTINLETTYHGKTGPLRWQRLADREMGLYIDPSIFMSSDGDSVIYAITAVDVPKAQPAYLLVSNDDDMKIWVNGELVSAHPAHEAKRISITLQAGRNTILVKLLQQTGLWYFQARLTDQFGAAFEDVTYAAPIPSPLTFPDPKPSTRTPNLPVIEAIGDELESYASGFPNSDGVRGWS